MSLTLRSAATGDLLLLSATAEQLLGLLGKCWSEPGIIQPQDMPAALQVLKGLSDEPPAADEAAAVAEAQAVSPDPQGPPAFHDEPISLRKRAVPLIKMIERAMAANKPIVWGV